MNDIPVLTHATERDIDLLLVEEFAASPLFARAVLGAIGLDHLGFIRATVLHSVRRLHSRREIDISVRVQTQAGDVLLGLPSTGLHTNGYSLARRVLPPETWGRRDPALGGRTVGEALMVPHRSYLPQIAALRAAGGRAFAHITGGGFPDNVARVLPDGVAAEIDLDTWQPPPIFRLLAAAGPIGREEMCRVFNMGIGLVAVVPAAVVGAAWAAVPEAVVIGRVTERDGPAVRLVGGETWV